MLFNDLRKPAFELCNKAKTENQPLSSPFLYFYFCYYSKDPNCYTSWDLGMLFSRKGQPVAEQVWKSLCPENSVFSYGCEICAKVCCRLESFTHLGHCKVICKYEVWEGPIFGWTRVTPVRGKEACSWQDGDGLSPSLASVGLKFYSDTKWEKEASALRGSQTARTSDFVKL